MTGQELKKILYNAHIQQNVLAEKLGMSKQSLGNMLSKDDIRTGLLEKICEVLQLKMSFFYPEPTVAIGVGENNNNGTMGMSDEIANKLIAMLQNKDDQLAKKDDHIGSLIQQNSDLISLMKEK